MNNAIPSKTATNALSRTSSSLSSVGDDLAVAGESTLRQARELASETLDRAGKLTSQGASQLTSAALDLASRGRAVAADRAKATQDLFETYAASTTRYVRAQPIKATLIALCAGLVLAKLFGGSSRSGRDDQS